MNCNIELQNSFKESGEICCPFCHKQVQQYISLDDQPCCSASDISEVDSRLVCKHRGQITGEKYQTEFIDFYQEMYKIRNKSIYNLKYHIENVITDLIAAHIIQITRAQTNQILGKFNKIQKVLPQSIMAGNEESVSNSIYDISFKSRVFNIGTKYQYQNQKGH